MSFYFGKLDTGYTTPKSHSHHFKSDDSTSGEKYSHVYSRNRDDSRESDRKSYRRHINTDDKEKLRESYRDRVDSLTRSNSKFGNDGGFAGFNLPQINWNSFDLSPLQKSFYVEHLNVKNRPQDDIDAFREKHQIAIHGSVSPRPIFSFEEAQFPNYISEQLTKKFQSPTPIQCQAWPAALGGYDVIGIAQTGSGKTLTFLLPGFVHINAQAPLKPGDGPIGLVIAPTRELAMQIHEECVKFGKNAKITSTCVFGGADRSNQQRELTRGNHIIIATPGRLLDFLEAGVVNLRRVTYLVLDEADRMLDMGFEPQIRKILSQVRHDRQTLMWSATWPREVQNLALEFCRQKPVHIVIGNTDLTVNLKIKQNIEVVEHSTKRQRIIRLLENIMDGSKILIFCQTKRGADSLTAMLGSYGLAAISIHGDKSQSQRDYIMRQYKTGKSNILVATDLAARGLDVADIKYVINYDFPTHIEDYIHRVGRTGRAGKDGVSFTFFTRDDYKHSSRLIDILEETEQRIPEELYRIARRPIPLDYYSQTKYHQKSSASTDHSDSNERSTPSQNKISPHMFTFSMNNQILQTPPSSNAGFYLSTPQDTQGTMNNINSTSTYQVAQSDLMSQIPQINLAELSNQMQAFFSLSNILNQMQEQNQDQSQLQALENLNSFLTLNPQFLSQNP